MAKGRLPISFELGDLVQLSSRWDSRIGIARADDEAWWVIQGHFDIAGCICGPEDVVMVIKKRAVPKKYLRYFH